MTRALFRLALITTLAGGCAAGEISGESAGYVDDGRGVPTFLDFEEATYQEAGEGGVYIVSGDTPVANRKQLREYYDSLFTNSLIVDRSGNSDNKWSDSQKHNLSYCVSNDFGNRKTQIVAAIAEATQGWEAASDVTFVYSSSQDSNCTIYNNNVLFDVRPSNGAPYLARAFFPNQSRQSRSVVVDSSVYYSGWSVSSVLAHELGHALGFRHEHTRPEAGTCFEDNAWRPLTPYDSASIMHYPQCNGSQNTLAFSQTDFNGAATLYGAPGGEEPTEPGNQGTARSGQASGSVASGEERRYNALAVVPGSPFEVSMTGTGDADLYVRFGSSATLSAYDCRPYRSGSSETCSLDVPSGETTAFIMIHGYTSATYTIEASWVEP